jgi:hypothetical protein
MSCVSRGFLSAQVVQRRFPRRHNEDEVLEWLGGTISPLTAKQARILGESNGGSGEASVHFKWCLRSGVRRWMWRGPHAFELRSGSMSQSDLGEELSRSSRSCLGVPGSGAV